MPEQAEIMEWRGCEVVDQDGDKVGKLDEIYLDRQTGKPEWAIVNTGLFGRKSSFIPLKDALREGEMIRVPYQKDHIKDAPNVDPDGEISQEEEQSVYAHYGLDYSEAQSESGLPENGGSAATGGAASGTSAAAGGGAGTSTTGGGSGPGTSTGRGDPTTSTASGAGTSTGGGPAAMPATGGPAGTPATGGGPGGMPATEGPAGTSATGSGPAGTSATGGGQAGTSTSGDGGGEASTSAGDAPGGSAGTSTTGGGAQRAGTARGESGSGLRLQRMIQEDVRLGPEGDEVIEQRTVEETKLTPDPENED